MIKKTNSNETKTKQINQRIMKIEEDINVIFMLQISKPKV